MYDIQGRVVFQSKLTSGVNTFSTDGLSAGVYVVNVNNGNKVQTKKLVIK
ncbi:T9SS type A sorting domain-containing protein [Flavobacterium sp.]